MRHIGFNKPAKKENPDAKPGRIQVEHPAGIEPVYSAWEADVLPLN